MNNLRTGALIAVIVLMAVALWYLVSPKEPVKVLAPVPIAETVTPPAQTDTPPLPIVTSEPIPETTPMATHPESQPEFVYVSGYIVNSANEAIPNAKVAAEWVTGYKTVTTDDDGRFSIPVNCNTFQDGHFLFTRKLTWKGETRDVPFRGEIKPNKIQGWLESRFGLFEVTGTRIGGGEGPFGTWEVSTEFKDEKLHPGVLTLAENSNGSVTGKWQDDIGPALLPRVDVPESMTISASRDNFRNLPESIAIPISGRDDLRLTILQESAISGTVADSLGKPLPEWTVFAIGQTERKAVRTDQFGQFTVPNLFPGTIELYASDPRVQERTNLGYPLQLNAGDHARGLRLIHHLGHTLSGYVTDTDGRPIVDVRVAAATFQGVGNQREYELLSRAVTDEKGHYTLNGMPTKSDAPVNLDVSQRDFFSEERTDIPFDGSLQNFSLRKKPIIAGRVVDLKTGKSIDRYRMAVNFMDFKTIEDFLMNLPVETLGTHIGGRFELRLRDERDTHVIVSAPGYASIFYPIAGLPLDSLTTGIEIAMKPMQRIRGIVVGPDNQPIQNAFIALGMPHITSPKNPGNDYIPGVTKTDAQGRFELSEYPDSKFTLSVFRHDYALETMEVWPPFRSLQVQLKKGARINVHFQATTKDSYAYAHVQLDGTTILSQRAKKQNAYTFEFENIPSGSIAVGVTLRQGDTGHTQYRDMQITSSGSYAANFDFTSQFNSFIEGTLTANGKPVSGIGMSAETELRGGVRRLFSANTNIDGYYRIGPLPAGTFKVGPKRIYVDGSVTHPTPEIVTTQTRGTTRRDINVGPS